MSCDKKVTRYRLLRCQHLRLSSDFEAFRRSKFRVYSPYCIVSAKRNECGGRRVGIVTARRLGNAVVRNHLRRLVREIFRLNQWALLPNADWLLILRSQARLASFRDLESDFLKVTAQIGNSLGKVGSR